MPGCRAADEIVAGAFGGIGCGITGIANLGYCLFACGFVAVAGAGTDVVDHFIAIYDVIPLGRSLACLYALIIENVTITAVLLALRGCVANTAVGGQAIGSILIAAGCAVIP